MILDKIKLIGHTVRMMRNPLILNAGLPNFLLSHQIMDKGKILIFKSRPANKGRCNNRIYHFITPNEYLSGH